MKPRSMMQWMTATLAVLLLMGVAPALASPPQGQQDEAMAAPSQETVAQVLHAAEQGNADAQYNLGVMYAAGQGVKKDDTQAVAWYRKAAEQGYVQAQTYLGIMLYHRPGRKKRRHTGSRVVPQGGGTG